MAPSDDWFRARGVAAGLGFFVIRLAPDRCAEFIDDVFEEHLGVPAARVMDDISVLDERVDPRDVDALAAAFALAPGTETSFELRWTHVDGHPVWTRVVASVRTREDGSVVAEGTSYDITEMRLAEQALARSEEQHRLLTENAYDVIWTMSVDGRVTYVSPSVERVRGITPEEAAAQTLEEIHPPESAARVTDYFGRLYAAMASGDALPTFHGIQEYYRRDGSIMTGELQVVPQVDADGSVVQILGVTRDVSERRAFEEELNRLVVTDPLTGAWNRRHGERIFAADLEEARRYGPALSLLLLDIDHFKEINDTHGHQVGDEVLIELTRRVTANLRASDVLVRWGGEEFVILMRHCTLDDARGLAEKIRAMIAEPPFDVAGTVTVSIGAAELGPIDDLSSWLDRADRAMYAAKAAGRNAVRSA